jgi:potassium/hydrogen antiporter
MEPLVAFMLGAIIGGTSSAVVIPLVRQLNISNNSRTILILESAFSDVLCIVFALAFIEAAQLGQIQVGTTIGQILASFILASKWVNRCFFLVSRPS